MANRARGLPDTFKLVVPASTLNERPVELGDYLDEETPAPPRKEPEPPAAAVSPPAASPEPQREETRRRPASRPRAAREPQESVEAPPPPRHPIPKPPRLSTSVPRKQLNMTPETIAMVDRLLDFIQTYSVQKDLKASELFHALVLALFEARESMDLSKVQPRGRWGSPTAAALPIALKKAFQKAMHQYHEEHG